MPNVIAPYYKVLFNNIDITEDISDDVLEIVYDEGDDGEADDLRILLDDMSGKWKDTWIVAVGQTIEVEIGYSNGRRLNCGKFQIDEVEYKGQPDSVELKCLSIGEDNKWREPDSHIFTGQTIEQIVQHFATKNNVKIQVIKDYANSNSVFESRVWSVILARVVQDREPDIEFLNRILTKFGLKFNLTPEKLYVYYAVTYETLAPVSNARIYLPEEIIEDGSRALYNGQFIDLESNIQLFSYELRNCSKYNVNISEVRYADPYDDTLYQTAVDFDGLPPSARFRTVGSDPEASLKGRKVYIDVDNDQQAELVAIADLYNYISKQIEGSFELDGAPEIVRGVAVPVLGLKKLSGNYYVTSSYHRLNRQNGYTTSAKVKWIAPATS